VQLEIVICAGRRFGNLGTNCEEDFGFGEPVSEGKQRKNRGRVDERKQESYTGLLLTSRRK
jgi:hypothetical protein